MVSKVVSLWVEFLRVLIWWFRDSISLVRLSILEFKGAILEVSLSFWDLSCCLCKVSCWMSFSLRSWLIFWYF